jgi:hypothetical protein
MSRRIALGAALAGALSVSSLVYVVAATAVVGTAVVGAACQSADDGCPDGDMACNGFCCEEEFYTCGPGPSAADSCLLTSCDDGLYLCANPSTNRNACVPVGAACCNDGGSCTTGLTCCANGDGSFGCVPIGATCCNNGSYCPVGQSCCSGGTACC